VFNFEIPNVAEQYVHRIGRTARAGADGIALSFIAEDERPYIKQIERLTGVKLAILPLPADFKNEAARLPAPAKRPNGAPEREVTGRGEGRREGGRGGNGSGRSPGGRGRDGLSRDAAARSSRGPRTEGARDGQRSPAQRDADHARAERRGKEGRNPPRPSNGAFEPLRENVDAPKRVGGAPRR